MLISQNLMTLCYLFLTSTLQKWNEIYTFKQLIFYDKKTEKSNYEQIKTNKSKGSFDRQIFLIALSPRTIKHFEKL